MSDGNYVQRNGQKTSIIGNYDATRPNYHRSRDSNSVGAKNSCLASGNRYNFIWTDPDYYSDLDASNGCAIP